MSLCVRALGGHLKVARRGLHLGGGPRRLPRGSRPPPPPESSPELAPEAAAEQWGRYLRQDALSRSVSAGGVESLERHSQMSFGSVRLDSINLPTLDAQEDKFEAALERLQAGQASASNLHQSDSGLSPAESSLQAHSSPVSNGPGPSWLGASPGQEFFEGDAGQASSHLQSVRTLNSVPRSAPSSSKVAKSLRRKGGDGFSFKSGKQRVKGPEADTFKTLKPEFDSYLEKELSVARKQTNKALEDAPLDNFFDEQFFPKSGAIESWEQLNLAAVPSSPSEKKEEQSAHTDGKEPKDLTIVDEQYFGGAKMLNVPVKVPPAEFKKVRKLVQDSTKDLSFVDSQISFPREVKDIPIPEISEAASPTEKTSGGSFGDFGSRLGVPKKVLQETRSRQLARDRLERASAEEELVTYGSFSRPEGGEPRTQHQRPSGALAYVRELRRGNMDVEKASDSKTKEDFVGEIGVSLKSRINSAIGQTMEELREREQEARRRAEGAEKGAVQSSSPTSRPLTKLAVKFKPKDLFKLTSMEVVDMLRENILYNDNDIVAISKPYGLPMFDQTGREPHTVEKYLPELAESLRVPYLYQVHRLDKTTSGVLLLASSKDMRKKLVELFRRRVIDKRYWAIARGVPEPKEGIIDIPLAEGKMPDGRYRMTIQPDHKLAEDKLGGKRKRTSRTVRSRTTYPAVTEYRVLQSFLNLSLLEVRPVTGFRHQIRAHLGFGLGCPVMGDHKFTQIGEIGKPQKLSGETLHRLRIRQSMVRELPLYLHAKHVQIPEIVPGKQVWVDAGLPHFYTKALERLKLKPHNSVRI